MAFCRWCSFLLPWRGLLQVIHLLRRAVKLTGRPAWICCARSGLQFRLPPGFQLLLHRSLNGCTFLIYLKCCSFWKHTLPCSWCALCSCEHDICWQLRRQAANRKELEHSSVDHRCNLCSHSTVHISFMLKKKKNPKLKKEGLSCSSHLGDLAGRLPLSLSIFLCKTCWLF